MNTRRLLGRSFKAKRIGKLFFLGMGAFLLFSPLAARSADSSTIRINEIAWMGTKQSSSDEWIELYNPNDKEIDLSGWILTLQGSKTTELKLKNTISKQGYYLIERTDDDTVPAVKADLVTSFGTGLSNDGLVMVLKDSAGAEIDRIDASKGWPAGDNDSKRTMERISNGWQTSFVPGGTPKQENSKKIDPVCGNGEIEEKESCDDGNTEQGDGCDSTCSVEIQYSKDIVINELLPDPIGNDTDGEWIELWNNGKVDIDLSGWTLGDASSKRYRLDNKRIASGEYLAIGYSTSKITLNNDGDAARLFGPDEMIVSQSVYGKIPQEGYAWARDKEGHFQWTMQPTKGMENKFDEKKSYPGNVLFYEILSNPKSIDKNNEWVELKNSNAFEVDLRGWVIENKAKRKYVIQDFMLPSHGVGVLYFKNTTFTIGNTNERLMLKDPNGETMDEVLLEGAAKERLSYNRTAKEGWKWSRFVTPGNENRFNRTPKISVKIGKKAYRNMAVSFEITKAKDQDKDKLTYRWDFGDGHRSYLKKTKHVYKKTGKYLVTLQVDDGSEKVLKTYSLQVKKYPHEKIELVSVTPNPEGKETEGETVALVLRGKTEQDLRGFSIATGKDKKSLVNHPIADEHVVKQNNVFVVTRSMCKMTLNNKAGLVELRYPDGNVADAVSYQKEKIEEGDVYQKKDAGWHWVQTIENDDQAQILASIGESREIPDSVVLGQTQVSPLVYAEQQGVCNSLRQALVSQWKTIHEKPLQFISYPW